MRKFCLFVVFLLVSSISRSQSLSAAWINRYAGTGDNSDVYNKIIPDGSGNYIAVGYTVRDGNYKDFLTVKLNSSLDTVWTRTKDGKGGGDDEAISVVVDGSGNIYVAGYIDAGNTNDDVCLVKYDGNGNTIWDTSYYSTTTAFLDDHPMAMAIAPSGNVVIAGWTEQGTWTSSTLDMLVLSYDPLGTLLFTKRYGRFANQRDEAAAVAVDGSGNIYVTGRSSNGIDDDWVTMKLNAAGTDLWTPVKIYDGGNGNDRPSAMAVTPAGNIVITGRTRGGNGDDDFHTVQYSSAGTLMWPANWAGAAGHDRPLAIAVDASNNVYVTGQSDRDASALVNYDISTVKYNSTGAQQWQRYWAGTAANDDVPTAITTDASGNIFICGTTDVDATSATNNDWVILKYDGSGTLGWQKTVSGSRNNDDAANSVVTDGSGNVYVAGSINNNTTQKDAGAVKYDSNGNLVFNKPYNGLGDFNDNSFAMVQDAGGYTYAAGYTYNEQNNRDIFITKIDVAGNTVISKTFQGTKGDDDELNSLVYDSNGYLYACGYTKVSGQKSDFITIKYTFNLDTVWTRTYNYSANQSDKAVSLAVDASGNVYVTGRSDSDANDTLDNRDIVTIKYNSSGVQQWFQRYNGTANLNDEPVKLILDNNGNVLIAGYSSNATDKDIALIAYQQSAGTPVSGFPAIFNSGSLKNDEASYIVADAGGNIYVSGYSEMTLPDEDYVLLKYTIAGGSPVWTKYYNGSAGQQDRSTSICLDSQGNIISTGQSDVDVNPLATNYDYLTLKYDASATSIWSALPDYNGNAGADDVPSVVLTDANDNVYVTGQSQEGTSLIKNKDIMTRIYIPDGTLALYADYDGGAGSDGANAMVVNGHSFFVAGYSDGFGSAQKDILTLKYDAPVGIIEVEPGQNSSYVYPNPFTSSANIILNKSVSSSANLTLHIFDVLGNEVAGAENVHAPIIQIKRGQLSQGMYQYKFYEGSKPVSFGKFVVN